MISLYQPTTPKHQFYLVSRSFDIGWLSGFSGSEEKFSCVSDGIAMSDACEPLKEKAPHVAQCFEAGAAFQRQHPAQFFVPIHASIVAQDNLSGQGMHGSTAGSA